MNPRHAMDLLLALSGAMVLCTSWSVLMDGAYTGSLFVSAVVAGVGAIVVAACAPKRRAR